MSSYVYELPTTGSVVFSDILSDPTGKHTNAISNATLARSNLRAALKESKRTDDDERDYLRIAKVIDDYLPHLYAIINCVKAGDLQLQQQPIFSWRTTLSANLLNNSPRQSVQGLYADLSFTLLTYASALTNLAASSVNALGNYERERAISDEQRKEKDSKLNHAVDLLKRSAGVFAYVAENAIPNWERSLLDDSGGQASAPTVRPVDLSKELVSALSRFSMAEAQMLVCRRLLSKSAYDSTLSPGPPLPKSHPSPIFVAKISLASLEHYSSALSLALSARGSRNSEVTKDLTRWLSDEKTLLAALSHKWLGVDAGENSSTPGKAGQAVGWLTWAKDELESLKDGGHGIPGLSRKGIRKERVAEELAATNAFLNHYRKLNNTIHFEPVTSVETLKSLIPSGTQAVQPTVFNPPAPAFKPASSSTPIDSAIEALNISSEQSTPQAEAAPTSGPRGPIF